MTDCSAKPFQETRLRQVEGYRGIETLALLDRHAPFIHNRVGECGQADDQADGSPVIGVSRNRGGERNARHGGRSVTHIYGAASGKGDNVRCSSRSAGGFALNLDVLLETAESDAEKDGTELAE